MAGIQVPPTGAQVDRGGFVGPQPSAEDDLIQFPESVGSGQSREFAAVVADAGVQVALDKESPANYAEPSEKIPSKHHPTALPADPPTGPPASPAADPPAVSDGFSKPARHRKTRRGRGRGRKNRANTQFAAAPLRRKIRRRLVRKKRAKAQKKTAKKRPSPPRPAVRGKPKPKANPGVAKLVAVGPKSFPPKPPSPRKQKSPEHMKTQAAKTPNLEKGPAQAPAVKLKWCKFAKSVDPGGPLPHVEVPLGIKQEKGTAPVNKTSGQEGASIRIHIGGVRIIVKFGS